MSIQNFPAALQPIIQQGFLEREFQDGLQSTLAYRNVADREQFAVNIGETLTKTKPGLKAPVTTPIVAASNTNLDNSLSSTSWTVEQYTISLNMYGDTIDLNMVTQNVGIAKTFLRNAMVNGIQAMQSVERKARKVRRVRWARKARQAPRARPVPRARKDRRAPRVCRDPQGQPV